MPRGEEVVVPQFICVPCGNNAVGHDASDVAQLRGMHNALQALGMTILDLHAQASTADKWNGVPLDSPDGKDVLVSVVAIADSLDLKAILVAVVDFVKDVFLGRAGF